MKKDNLTSILLRLVCCLDDEDNCVCPSCPCCCDWLWMDRKPKKADIQYVLQKPVDDVGGYDNEGCVVGGGGSSKDLVSDHYHQIEIRRHNSISVTPAIIDMKPIQFWTAQTSPLNVQPHFVRKAPLPAPPSLLRPLLVGSLQPHLYQLSPSSSLEDLSDDEKLARFGLGELHFSVQYELPSRLLLVRVIGARHLPTPGYLSCTRTDLAHSNPYVKLCLLPDRKNSRQTSVKRKTQDPIYEETFAFEVSFREAQMRTLQLRVKDFDKYSRHCVVGEVLLPLLNVNMSKGKHMWKALLPCEMENMMELGEILLSLNYLPSAGRLNVDVIKAKQLLQTDMDRGSVPYVRLSLVMAGKHLKSKKTSPQKNTIDPVFNESFSFNVVPVDLQEASLVVTVWDYNSSYTRDTFVGRIVLGKVSSTGPGETNHWQRMLKTQRSATAQWHTLRARQECDQISSASRVVP